MQFTGRGLVAFLAIVGGVLTAAEIGKGAKEMEGQHWLMLVIFLVAGYVLGRIWTTPAQMVGLP